MPCEIGNKDCYSTVVQEAVCKVNRRYLIDGSKHPVTQQLRRPELRGLQDSSVDLGPLLSRLQRLKALKAGSVRVKTEQKETKDDTAIRLWLTSPRSMYLLIARLRRMARPRRYSRVSTNTEKETKRRTMTPTTMPVTVCLMATKQEMIREQSSKLDETQPKLLPLGHFLKIWVSNRCAVNSPIGFNAVSDPWAVAAEPTTNSCRFELQFEKKKKNTTFECSLV